MKRFLMILVLGLLLSGCDSLVNKDHFKFDKCWNKDKYESFSASYKDEDIYEEWFFEINLPKETVTHTVIYYDDWIKSNPKYKAKKVNLETYPIKSVTKNFVEANTSSRYSYLFNLKNGELTYSSDSLSINFKCDKF